MERIITIILAAGHGKRMNHGSLPKVLVPFKDKPMIHHLLESIKTSKVCDKPAIVIGYKSNHVKKSLGDNYHYIHQEEQLGTGHAVSCCKEELKDKAKNIMVLYGDHPNLSHSTIKNIADTHISENKVLTLATAKVEDFNEWRSILHDFGRVVRNASGKITRIVEKKDASPQELSINEVNPSYFCFKADWLWENLQNLKNNNAQNEYYLTDLLQMAFEQQQEIANVLIEPQEALGANTPEQLELVKNSKED
jgi:bifunctional UDP-N-acetylglucosamine pyrophosphorylase / glucosamine-1-phosphate N-acetyltransferase